MNIMFSSYLKTLIVLAITELTWREACARPERMDFISTSYYNQRGLIESISDFGQRLTMNLMKTAKPVDNGNMLISPLSVSSVLAMMRLGAGGETRKEIDLACGFGENVHKNFKLFNHATFFSPIGEAEKQVSDSLMANGMFHDYRTKVKSEFRNQALEYHNAQVEAVNFNRAPEAARQVINGWVRNKTRGMIKDLLSSYDVTMNTQVVIANAVFFRGSWKYQFEPTKTATGLFTTMKGENIEVPMMFQKNRFNCRLVCPSEQHAISHNHKCSHTPQPNVIEIPYADGNHVLIILVSNNLYSMKEIEENLQANYIRWRKGMLRTEVELSMPKFQVDFQSDLVPTLMELGINKAFHIKKANFKNMSENKISFSKFVHRSKIVVDESGSIAASSSSVVSILRSAGETEYFNVDRPFMFYIEDLRTGLQLFAGRITDPRKLN